MPVNGIFEMFARIPRAKTNHPRMSFLNFLQKNVRNLLTS